LHVLRDFFVTTMQKTDVRRRFGNDFTIEFEHESQHSVGGWMRWSHVEHHLFADVVSRLLSLLIAHRHIRRDHSSDGIRIFNFTRSKGHGEGVCLCSRVMSRAQAQKVELRNPGCRAILQAKLKFAEKLFARLSL